MHCTVCLSAAGWANSRAALQHGMHPPQAAVCAEARGLQRRKVSTTKQISHLRTFLRCHLSMVSALDPCWSTRLSLQVSRTSASGPVVCPAPDCGSRLPKDTSTYSSCPQTLLMLLLPMHRTYLRTRRSGYCNGTIGTEPCAPPNLRFQATLQPWHPVGCTHQHWPKKHACVAQVTHLAPWV